MLLADSVNGDCVNADAAVMSWLVCDAVLGYTASSVSKARNRAEKVRGDHPPAPRCVP